MRLFVAIDLPDHVRAALEAWIDRYKSAAAGYRWSKPENIHLTLKFIGERPAAEVPAIGEALAHVPFPQPVEIKVDGTGSFPNVLFANLRRSEPLIALAAAIEQSLAPLGIAQESRAYTPHLTLGRRKEGGRFPKDLGAAENFGEFTAVEFILYQSVLGPGGSTYTPIRRYRCPNL